MSDRRTESLSLKRDLRLFTEMWKWMTPSVKRSLVLGLGAIAVQSALLVASARWLGHLVEYGLVARNLPWLIRGLSFSIALALGSALVGIVGRWLLNRTALDAVQAIRNRLLSLLPDFSHRFFDRARMGDLLFTLTAEVDSLSPLFRDILGRSGLTLVYLTFLLLGAARIQPILAGWLVSGILPALIAGSLLRRPLRRSQRALAETESNLSAVLSELGSGWEALAGVGAGKWILDKSVTAIETEHASRLVSSRWEAFSSSFLPALCYLPLVAVVAAATFGGSAWISLGVWITFLRLGQQLVFPIQTLTMESLGLQGIFRALERIQQLASAEKDQPTPATIEEPFIKLRFDAATATENGRSRFRRVSFDLRRGEILGIAGPSGSGKSSLAGALLRRHELESGSILWNAKNIRSIPTSALHARIAYAPSRPLLLPCTIRENLLLDNDVRPERLDQVLEALGLTKWMVSRSLNLDSQLAPGAFSLGERQLLQLARVLTQEACLVILDEATGALESQQEMEVLKKVLTLGDRTFVIISHRASALNVCHRILHLKEGRVVEPPAQNRLVESAL